MSSLLRNLFGRGTPPAPRVSVLFVCMGNICRSPTAEAVFRRQVQLAGLESEFGCDSAGTTDAHAGDAPDGRAQAAARKRGYEMDRLRARQAVVDDFARFDLVLAMDRHNLAILEALCPQGSSHKLRMLMEYARRHDVREVPDPYYGSARGFEAVLDMIEDACEGLIEKLRETPARSPEDPPAPLA
jgi:protein-tyrosine phosphatase